MSWNITRRATADDVAAVEKAAVRFCTRHGINVTNGTTAVFSIECEISKTDAFDTSRVRYLARLWRAILKRITGSPDGIAYGYVGTQAN